MNPVLGFLLRFPLHGFGLLVAALPRSVELVLGRLLGRLALAVDRKRSAIARENIRRCLPELGDEGREALLRRNFEHYGVLALELLHMFAPIPGHWKAYAGRVARLEGFENWKRAHDRGRGTLFCSGHFANWELAAAAGAQGGMPLTIVTRRLKPAWLDRWMEKTRLSAGVRCAYQPRTMPAVMKGLREGRAITFAVDQYMIPPMGKRLRFFGAEVDTLAAIAPLARRTGAAIVPAWQQRDEKGIVHIWLDRELVLGEDDDADNQRISDRMESWVRAEPSQWLWAHRRFKNAVWPAALIS